MKKIGSVSVDSGTILIADPCYWLNDKTYQKEIVKPDFDLFRAIPHDRGMSGGKGLITTTGFGDGQYPVYAEIKKGRIKSITIEFF